MSGFFKIVAYLHFNRAMPVDESKTQSSKKCSQKKGRTTRSKSKPKYGSLNKKQSIDMVNHRSSNSRENQLTPANLSSLRWEDTLTDPALEEDRIERYKELRRQRYIDAQQKTIQKLTEQKKLSLTHA